MPICQASWFGKIWMIDFGTNKKKVVKVSGFTKKYQLSHLNISSTASLLRYNSPAQLISRIIYCTMKTLKHVAIQTNGQLFVTLFPKFKPNLSKCSHHLKIQEKKTKKILVQIQTKILFPVQTKIPILFPVQTVNLKDGHREQFKKNQLNHQKGKGE